MIEPYYVFKQGEGWIPEQPLIGITGDNKKVRIEKRACKEGEYSFNLNNFRNDADLLRHVNSFPLRAFPISRHTTIRAVLVPL